MKKDKILRNKTYLDGMFPQVFPQGKMGGETNQDEPYNQPSVGEIWEWLGNPDEY